MGDATIIIGPPKGEGKGGRKRREGSCCSSESGEDMDLGGQSTGEKAFLNLSLSPRIPSFPGVNVVVGVRVMHAEVEELLARSNNNVAGIKEKSQPCPPKLDYM